MHCPVESGGGEDGRAGKGSTGGLGYNQSNFALVRTERLPERTSSFPPTRVIQAKSNRTPKGWLSSPLNNTSHGHG